MFEIRRDDLSGEATRALLRLHLQGMHASSPKGASFALDLSGLAAPGVTVWTAWSGDQIAGIGALKRMAPDMGEIKSMRTHPDFARRGVGRALLEHILDQARALGLKRVVLETGTGPAFEAAHALYASRGFKPGEPFADYAASDFHRFYHLSL